MKRQTSCVRRFLLFENKSIHFICSITLICCSFRCWYIFLMTPMRVFVCVRRRCYCFAFDLAFTDPISSKCTSHSNVCRPNSNVVRILPVTWSRAISHWHFYNGIRLTGMCLTIDLSINSNLIGCDDAIRPIDSFNCQEFKSLDIDCYAARSTIVPPITFFLLLKIHDQYL